MTVSANAGTNAGTNTNTNNNLTTVPAHIAVIMDGNGRWAKRRGLPRTLGHREGAETLKKITRYCHRLGVRYLTVFALSTENWKRPPDEVSGIIRLLRHYIASFDNDPERANVSFRFIGDMERLDEGIRRDFTAITEKTRNNPGAIVLTIAFNYGGRNDILRAAREAARLAADGRIKPEELDERGFSKLLDTGDAPDPDLLIRTGAEYRISNFMLWQAAYAELWFTDTLWPDFTEKDIDAAIADFSGRGRRFGGVAQ